MGSASILRRLLAAWLVCGPLQFASAQPETQPIETRPVDSQPGQWNEIAEGERLFALQIAPMLESKCVACHGQSPTEIESGLDISNLAAALRGGDSGDPVLTLGNREESWLYLAATWEHEQVRMPPKENDRLDAAALEALGRWIDLGAPWPSDERTAEIRQQLASGITLATSGGLDGSWDGRRYEPETLWAYQPLRRYPVPSGSDILPAANAVDAFINAELVTRELQPAPRASRRELIRRVYFDLTGLPPSPYQVQQFVDNPVSDQLAWVQLVDQLLSSPNYGEQWGRHWLDSVRYADSAGYANDYERPNAWRYRDYVIRSLNEDRPLDRFIREQIAGDEIDPVNPEMLIATGMLRMGPWEQTGMSVDRVTRQQFLDDVTDVIGQAFLAHPLQCARCHDHKFDPIPTRDYYQIQAVFATTQFAEREAAFLPGENQRLFDEQSKYLRARIEFFEDMLQGLSAKEEAAQRQWYTERNLEYAPRNEKLKQGVAEEEIAPRKLGFEPRDFGLERIARKYLERHRWELDRYRPFALSVYAGPTPERRGVSSRIAMPEKIEGSGKVEETAILAGGDPFSPTVTVTPGILSVLSSFVGSPQSPAPSISSHIDGRRLEFAEWITDPLQNPLTPRVMVNRLWQHHFGKGLVATANNFGTAGAKPTHPELLDYLASELVDSDWSVKHIHRLIVTSEAYCRSIYHPAPDQLLEQDASGTSYARYETRRLAAEELRDAVLAISGLLNSETGGVPIRPEINAEVASQPRQIMGTYAPVYQPSPAPEDRHRRTLYALRLRGLQDPMLEVFNQPSPDIPCEARDSSTVAPQALTLFNSPLSYNRALAMAERLLNEAGGIDGDRPAVIDRAFELAYSRRPSVDELRDCLRHWSEMEQRHRSIQLSDLTPPHELPRVFVDENTGQEFSFTEPLEQNRDYRAAVAPSSASAESRGLAEVCLVLLASNELLYVP